MWCFTHIQVWNYHLQALASDVIFQQKLEIFAMEKWASFLVVVVGMVFCMFFFGGFEVLILKMKDVRIVYFLVKFSVVLDLRNEDDVHLFVGSVSLSK